MNNKYYKINQWLSIIVLGIFTLISLLTYSNNLIWIACFLIFGFENIYYLFRNKELMINKYHEILKLVALLYLLIILVRGMFDPMLRIESGYNILEEYLRFRFYIIILILQIMNIYKYFNKQEYEKINIIINPKINYNIMLFSLIMNIILFFVNSSTYFAIRCLIMIIHFYILQKPGLLNNKLLPGIIILLSIYSANMISAGLMLVLYLNIHDDTNKELKIIENI